MVKFVDGDKIKDEKVKRAQQLEVLVRKFFPDNKFSSSLGNGFFVMSNIPSLHALEVGDSDIINVYDPNCLETAKKIAEAYESDNPDSPELTIMTDYSTYKRLTRKPPEHH